jgi:hypothetical protein
MSLHKKPIHEVESVIIPILQKRKPEYRDFFELVKWNKDKSTDY